MLKRFSIAAFLYARDLTLTKKLKSADTESKRRRLEKLLKTLENTSETGFTFLPHGIVLGRHAAENVVRFVDKVEGFRGGRLAAVGTVESFV